MAYDSRIMPQTTESQLRGLVFALLVFGLIGTILELTALRHYKDSWQLVPMASLILAVLVCLWYALSRSGASLRVLRVLMWCFIAVGLTGLVLHFRSNMAFQLDADPELSGWPLIVKILHSKAPPALAPGAIAGLGLLGLIFVYKHPGLRR